MLQPNENNDSRNLSDTSLSSHESCESRVDNLSITPDTTEPRALASGTPRSIDQDSDASDTISSEVDDDSVENIVDEQGHSSPLKLSLDGIFNTHENVRIEPEITSVSGAKLNIILTRSDLEKAQVYRDPLNIFSDPNASRWCSESILSEESDDTYSHDEAPIDNESWLMWASISFPPTIQNAGLLLLAAGLVTMSIAAICAFGLVGLGAAVAVTAVKTGAVVAGVGGLLAMFGCFCSENTTKDSDNSTYEIGIPPGRP